LKLVLVRAQCLSFPSRCCFLTCVSAPTAELEGTATAGGSTASGSATSGPARPADGAEGTGNASGDRLVTTSTSSAGQVTGNLSPRLALAQLKAIGDDLGPHSVDWRLATPQMAKSLSQHLCDAFFTSCCVLLPAFSYYREKMPEFINEKDLPSSTKVSDACFTPCVP